jgi:hypothetical protein
MEASQLKTRPSIMPEEEMQVVRQVVSNLAFFYGGFNQKLLLLLSWSPRFKKKLLI